MVVAVPVILGPQWALMRAELRFEPYEHVGWAWRLLLSLPLAALLILVVGSMAWLAFSRSSVRKLSTLCIVYAMPVHAYRAIGYLNVAFDYHPGVVEMVECIRYIHRAKGPNLVEVTSWRDLGRTLQLRSLSVREAECVDRHPLRIVVHPGRFGMEWISPAR